MKEHLVTTLSIEHEKVIEVLTSPPTGKNIYNISSEYKDNPEQFARDIANQVLELPIKTGEKVIILVGQEDIIAEHLIVSSLQRRFNECIYVEVKRADGHSALVPYLTSLREDPRKSSDLTDYNYHCSGNCSSCGGH